MGFPQDASALHTFTMFQEVQRWANIIPQNLMRLTAQSTMIDGHRIEAGTRIAPQISNFLYDEKVKFNILEVITPCLGVSAGLEDNLENNPNIAGVPQSIRLRSFAIHR